MRILYIIDSLIFGGTQRQLVELVKGIDKTSYDIHVASLYDINSEGYIDILKAENINLYHFPRKHKYQLIPLIINLRKLIIAHNIDIINTFLPFSSFIGALAAKSTHTPVICSAIRNSKDRSYKEKYLYYL